MATPLRRHRPPQEHHNIRVTAVRRAIDATPPPPPPQPSSQSHTHSRSRTERTEKNGAHTERSGLSTAAQSDRDDGRVDDCDYRSDPTPPWQGVPRTIHTRSGLVWRTGGRPCVSARSNRPDRAITTTSALAMSLPPTSRATRRSRRGFVLAHSVVAVVARSTSTRRACWTTLSSARSFDKLELSSHI